MVLTKKINKDTVAVLDTYFHPSMLIRNSGKDQYGHEEEVVSIRDGKLIVNENIAQKYGLKLDVYPAIGPLKNFSIESVEIDEAFYVNLDFNIPSALKKKAESIEKEIGGDYTGCFGCYAFRKENGFDIENLNYVDSEGNDFDMMYSFSQEERELIADACEEEYTKYVEGMEESKTI